MTEETERRIAAEIGGLVKTTQRAGRGPVLVTRWRWRARGRCKMLELARDSVFYRWEVIDRDDGRFEVASFQNRSARS